MSRLMSPEERERRLRIIEQGVKTDFWRIAQEQVAYINTLSMQEIVDLHWDGKHEEAKNLAIQVRAKQEFMKEPASIIRQTKPVFDEWNGREWVRKTAESLKRVFSGGNPNV